MFNMKKFADLLSVKRKAKGLTQDQLADLVGVSHQAVSKWERAEALPEISKIGDIALAIETPAEELINTLYESQPSTAPTTNSSADEAYFALIDKTRVGEIYALAPNMSKETLALAIDTIVAEKGTSAATMLFRFASEEYLGHIGKQMLASGDVSLAKYVDEPTLQSTVVEYISSADTTADWRQKNEKYLRAGKLLVLCKDLEFINDMFDHMVAIYDTWNVWKSIITEFPSEVLVHQGIKFAVRKGTGSFGGWWGLLGRRNVSKLFLGYADYFKNNAQAWWDIMLFFQHSDASIIESGIKERVERNDLDIYVLSAHALKFTPEMSNFLADHGMIYKGNNTVSASPKAPQNEKDVWNTVSEAINKSTENPSLLRARLRFEEEFDIKLQDSDVRDWPEIIKWADTARKELYPEYDTPDNAILKEILNRLRNIEEKLDDVESMTDDLEDTISDLESRIDELE
ncbi:MAG: helix-turn-helix transcriptional regulator [Clostridia bacterium]|nr:helix-turn-helix transcriptional regulator [Clostridia bacterium]